MKKLFCLIITVSLIATAALASDFSKAQKIFDELTKLMANSSQMITAYNKRDMTTCDRLEKFYAPKLKELYESSILLDSDYSYTKQAADVVRWCLSCSDTISNCEYATEIMQKASDQFIRRENEGKK